MWFERDNNEFICLGVGTKIRHLDEIDHYGNRTGFKVYEIFLPMNGSIVLNYTETSRLQNILRYKQTSYA